MFYQGMPDLYEIYIISRISIWIKYSIPHNLRRFITHLTICYYSVTKSCPTLFSSTNWSTPDYSVLHHLPKIAQICVHWISDLTLFGPLLLLPSIYPSIRVFSNESALHIRWPKYWSFSFNVSLSSEYAGLIFFRIDWVDLLAAEGTLKSLLQHHNLKAQVLLHSAFFTV